MSFLSQDGKPARITTSTQQCNETTQSQPSTNQDTDSDSSDEGEEDNISQSTKTSSQPKKKNTETAHVASNKYSRTAFEIKIPIPSDVPKSYFENHNTFSSHCSPAMSTAGGSRTINIQEGDFLQMHDGSVCLVYTIQEKTNIIFFCQCTVHEDKEIRICAKWNQSAKMWETSWDTNNGCGGRLDPNKVARVLEVRDFNVHSIVQFDVYLGDAWESHKTEKKDTVQYQSFDEKNDIIAAFVSDLNLDVNDVKLVSLSKDTQQQGHGRFFIRCKGKLAQCSVMQRIGFFRRELLQEQVDNKMLTDDACESSQSPMTKLLKRRLKQRLNKTVDTLDITKLASKKVNRHTFDIFQLDEARCDVIMFERFKKDDDTFAYKSLSSSSSSSILSSSSSSSSTSTSSSSSSSPPPPSTPTEIWWCQKLEDHIHFKTESYTPLIRKDHERHASASYLEKTYNCLTDKRKMEFFAGIGLFATGTNKYFKLKVANEKCGFASKVLERNFAPEIGSLPEDQTRVINGTLYENDFGTSGKWGESALRIADINSRYHQFSYGHASPPCQDYSSANAKGQQGGQQGGVGGEVKDKNEEEETTSVSNAHVADAVARYISAFQPPFFTVEEVPAWFASNTGKCFYNGLLDLGYNCQIVTIQAALHGDIEPGLNNDRFPLSRRLRPFLLCSRPDMCTIQIDNPTLFLPKKLNLWTYISKPQVRRLIDHTKLVTIETTQYQQIPNNLAERFTSSCADAGLPKVGIATINDVDDDVDDDDDNYEDGGSADSDGEDANDIARAIARSRRVNRDMINIGHLAHPTRWNFDTLNRSEDDIQSMRLQHSVSKAIMTDPTTAGKKNNEIMPPGHEKRTITPAEAAVLMGVTKMSDEHSRLNSESCFYILPTDEDPREGRVWEAAFRGVGNGVPIGVGRAVGNAVHRALLDSAGFCRTEKNLTLAKIKQKKQRAKLNGKRKLEKVEKDEQTNTKVGRFDNFRY